MKTTCVYLTHIYEQSLIIRNILEKIDYETFSTEPLYTNAIIRSLEIIGEAAKHIPEEYRIRHSEIQWKGMAGLRDRLIHGYFSVDTIYVWEIITQDIPTLIEQIPILLKEQ